MKKIAMGISALLVLAACKGGDGAVSQGSNLTQPKEGVTTVIGSEKVDANLVVELSNRKPEVSQAALDAFRNSVEYLSNPGMRSGRMDRHIASGLSGKGVHVAVWDSGIDTANSNLQDMDYAGRLATTDSPYTDANSNNGTLRHGTSVAQIIAGDAGDGDQARGIAPNATIHDVVALIEADEKRNQGVNYYSVGFRYFADNKIDIVNVSMSTRLEKMKEDPHAMAQSFFSDGMREDIRRAVENGTIFVVSVGNTGEAQTDNALASIGLLPEAKGHAIVVAALMPNQDALMSFSTRCGTLKDYCISAVGAGMPVIDRNGRLVHFSGTSAAAPVVSGALALLKEQFPEISSATLVELVFATARDLGAPGVDEIFGRGALDLSRALAPVGEVKVAMDDTTQGATIALDDAVVHVSGAGAGLMEAVSQNIIVIDDFERGFVVGADQMIVRDADAKPFFQSTMTADTIFGRVEMDDEGGMLLRGPVTLGYGSTEFAMRGKMFFNQGYGLGYGASNENVMLGTKIDNFSALLSFDGSESRRVDFAYDMADNKGGNLRFGLGYMEENGRLLGNDIVEGHAKTLTFSLEGSSILTENITLRGGSTISKTSFGDGVNYFVSGDMLTLGGQLSIEYKTADAGVFSIALGTPIGIRSGSINSNIAIGRGISDGANDNTDVNRMSYTTELGSNQVYDLGLGWSKDFGNGLNAAVKASWRFDDQIAKDERLTLGLGLNWTF